jgi:hypothetical protein
MRHHTRVVVKNRFVPLVSSFDSRDKTSDTALVPRASHLEAHLDILPRGSSAYRAFPKWHRCCAPSRARARAPPPRLREARR